VLAHWHQTGHRALLFTQTQQMLDIAESAMQARTLCDDVLLACRCTCAKHHEYIRLPQVAPVLCMTWHIHSGSVPARPAYQSTCML
jgi:hypothetical protein